MGRRSMPWNIENSGNAVVVTMNSNSAGTMNDGFFEDLNSAFSLLRQSRSPKPVVLASGAKMFSPGLDLQKCVPLFKKGCKPEIDRWFEGFLNSMLAVFDYPAPVVAAVEGHAIAGGCILALCCDMRVAGKGKTLVGLNETSIGFPMPRSLDALVTGVLGDGVGREMIDGGKLYTVEEALAAGVVHELSEPGEAVLRGLSRCLPVPEKDRASRETVSENVRREFAEFDSKTLAEKLSSPETVRKLESLLETLKKGRKR